MGEPAGTHSLTHTTHRRVIQTKNSTHNPPGRVRPPPLLTRLDSLTSLAWIQLFDFSIKHVPGTKHLAADALSQ